MSKTVTLTREGQWGKDAFHCNNLIFNRFYKRKYHIGTKSPEVHRRELPNHIETLPTAHVLACVFLYAIEIQPDIRTSFRFTRRVVSLNSNTTGHGWV